MTEIIRNKVVEEEAPVAETVVYEKVSEQVSSFTIEDVNREIEMLEQDIIRSQIRIDELEAKKATACAMSSGVPLRFNGIISKKFSRASSGTSSQISVST